MYHLFVLGSWLLRKKYWTCEVVQLHQDQTRWIHNGIEQIKKIIIENEISNTIRVSGFFHAASADWGKNEKQAKNMLHPNTIITYEKSIVSKTPTTIVKKNERRVQCFLAWLSSSSAKEVTNLWKSGPILLDGSVNTTLENVSREIGGVLWPDWETLGTAQNNFGSFDIPMGADNDDME